VKKGCSRFPAEERKKLPPTRQYREKGEKKEENSPHIYKKMQREENSLLH